MFKKLRNNKFLILIIAAFALIFVILLLFSAHKKATLSEPSRVLGWRRSIDDTRTYINRYFRELPDYYMVGNEEEKALQTAALAALFSLSDEIPNLTDKEMSIRIGEIISNSKSGNMAANIGWTRDMAIIDFHMEEYFQLFYDIANNDADALLYNEVIAELDRLKADIPNLTELEIKIRIQYITAMLGDGHTYTSLVKTGEKLAVGEKKTYPFYANSYEDGLWIVGVYREKYSEAINCKILEINNVSIDEIFTRLCAFVGYENEIFVKVRYGVNIALPENLYAIKIIEHIDDEISLTLQDLSGNKRTVVFDEKITTTEFLDNPEVSINNLSKETRNASFITDRVDGEKAFYASRPDEDIWTEYIEENKMLYVRLQTFTSFEGNNMNPRFDPFGDIKEISDKYDIEKIVLDYRGNGGGWARIDYPWLDLIIELSEAIPLYLITNWSNYSAASNQALYFKNNTNAITIGLPTGSGLATKAGIKEVPFLSRNFSIVFSYVDYHKTHSEDTEKILNGAKVEDYADHSIYPDIYMGLDIHDYINKHDPVLEYIKGL